MNIIDVQARADLKKSLKRFEEARKRKENCDPVLCKARVKAWEKQNGALKGGGTQLLNETYLEEIKKI